MVADLRADQKLVGILEADIGEEIAGPLLDLERFPFFHTIGQLPCFCITLLDQVHIALRGRDAFLRFLLRGVQHINPSAKLQPPSRRGRHPSYSARPAQEHRC